MVNVGIPLKKIYHHKLFKVFKKLIKDEEV